MHIARVTAAVTRGPAVYAPVYVCMRVCIRGVYAGHIGVYAGINSVFFLYSFTPLLTVIRRY